MAKHHQQKTVKFTPDTSFKPGRDIEQFLRGSACCVSGKYACPKESREWLDTSLMSDTLEQLLDLKVHKTCTACDEEEVYTLYDEFAEKMESGKPLGLGSGPLLRDHPLYQEALNAYVAYRESGGGCDAGFDKQELARAKALVLYQDRDGGFLGFQFLNDVYEDVEADEYIAELRRSIPADNRGEL
jgi:hypothetical protein